MAWNKRIRAQILHKLEMQFLAIEMPSIIHIAPFNC